MRSALHAQAPTGILVEREMTIRLDDRNRPEPDVVVAATGYDPERTWFAASDVLLVVEVVSRSPRIGTVR
jgi:Uma2 family endonuclease